MTNASATMDVSHKPVTAPYGRRAAEFALALGTFGIGIGEFGTMGILPDVAKDVHRSVPQTGELISAYALGVTVGAPLITVLCARMPRHILLISLIAIYATGNMATGLMGNFPSIIVTRFLAGLPHGAYFGLAGLVAAALAPPHERARAIGRVMLGLTIATVIGVPLATLCAQAVGWRSMYWIVGGLGVVSALLLSLCLPRINAAAGASPLTELSALARPQIWLTLATGAIGFGGLFSVYSYIAPGLIHAANAAPAMIPVVLTIFGLGMTLGTTIGASLIDRAPRRATAGFLVWNILACATLVVTVHNVWSALVTAALVGFGIVLAPAMQARLMDFAASAQSLAAALNQSAFNIANALGAWLAGAAIASTGDWGAPGWVGALLALGGLCVFLVSLAIEKKQNKVVEEDIII